MAYNSWKLMDKIDVAVRNRDDGDKNFFNGYVVEHGDKKALESAINWATVREWDEENKVYKDPIKPNIHTFDNGGFSVKILNSASGSSQGGRLSFWKCEVEKDGIKFIIGVNDAILADLIRNSDISKGVVKQKVMFARKSGQPGFLHEGMQTYQDALVDMKKKSDMKKAKKTNKWEIGGIYKTLTRTDICIGKVWDWYEEVPDRSSRHWYYKTKFQRRYTPIEVYAWFSLWSGKEDPDSFTDALLDKLESGYVWFDAGIPPARSLYKKLEVKKSDYKLIDKILLAREDADQYARIKGRYIRKSDET